MRQVIKQILHSISTEPDKWEPYSCLCSWDGIKKDDVKVGGVGNTKILSIIRVQVKDIPFTTSWIENYRLEKAVMKWYQSCDIETILTS